VFDLNPSFLKHAERLQERFHNAHSYLLTFSCMERKAPVLHGGKHTCSSQ